MLEKDGVPTIDEIKAVFPDRIVLKKPKAIIECYREIPCNPCSTSCPFDAIFIPEDINKRPIIDYDKCTGCGVCVYNCPGLAITVRQLKNDKLSIKIPYEFYPLPKIDTFVNISNRLGKIITKGKITNVKQNDKMNKTALITVEIEEQYYMDAMSIEVPYGS